MRFLKSGECLVFTTYSGNHHRGATTAIPDHLAQTLFQYNVFADYLYFLFIQDCEKVAFVEIIVLSEVNVEEMGKMWCAGRRDQRTTFGVAA